MSHRIIVEATVKLVLDVDTDALEEEYPDLITREEILEKAVEQFTEETSFSFDNGANATVVESYSELRGINIKSK